ncbi:MAG: hypothetical protein ACI4UC_09100 [Alloprevotella sp.]
MKKYLIFVSLFLATALSAAGRIEVAKVNEPLHPFHSEDCCECHLNPFMEDLSYSDLFSFMQQSPSVTFESTWVTANDTVTTFHISKVRYSNLSGHTIATVFWIADANKNSLKDKNNKYKTVAGDVSVATTREIANNNYYIEEISVDMPNSEFHLDRNKNYNLYYSVGFYEVPSTGKNICESGYNYAFTLKAKASAPTPRSSQPHRELQPVQVWYPCLSCGGTGKCACCQGQGKKWYGNSYENCVCCYGGMACTTCYGRRGYYSTEYR